MQRAENDDVAARLREQNALLRQKLKEARGAVATVNARNEKLKQALAQARQGPAAKRGPAMAAMPAPPQPAVAVESYVASEARTEPRMILDAYAPWCAFGVRDPSFLTDESNRPVRHEGMYRMFFNGRDRSLRENGMTRTGWARSHDLLEWEPDPDPVFSDGDFATTGGAVRLDDGTVRLYYSFDTARGFRCATTRDFRHWSIEKTPLLTPDPFGCRRMGLPHVFRWDGTWYLLFEGLRMHFGIFAARSDDGLSWEPMNGGEPIWRGWEGRWDRMAQANPGFANPAGRPPMILYKGYAAAGDWDIGFLTSDRPFRADWSSLPRPLIGRGDVGEGTCRLEGGRIAERDGETHLFFFDLPDRDSYRGGRIWGLPLSDDILGAALDAACAEVPGGTRMAPQARFEAPRISAEGAAPPAGLAAEEDFNDTLAGTYFDIWDAYPIQRLTNELEGAWLRDLVAPGDRVLLVGSGGGREIVWLLDRGVEITAMDLSAGMLEAGKRRFGDAPIRWIQGDAHRPPDDLEAFDHVIGLGLVLCYLPDPDLALHALRGILRPGGRLTLGVVNSEHFAEGKSHHTLASGRVRNAFSLRELTAMLGRANYMVQEAHGHRFFADGLPADWNRPLDGNDPRQGAMQRLLDLERDLPDLLPAERGKQLWVTARAL